MRDFPPVILVIFAIVFGLLIYGLFVKASHPVEEKVLEVRHQAVSPCEKYANRHNFMTTVDGECWGTELLRYDNQVKPSDISGQEPSNHDAMWAVLCNNIALPSDEEWANEISAWCEENPPNFK